MNTSRLDYLNRICEWVLRCCCLIASLLFAAVRPGQSLPAADVEDVQALVRQVVENELQALKKPTYWKYILQAQTADERRTEFVVETRQGMLKCLLAQNGRVLTPNQLQQENQRIWSLIHNPRELAKQAHDDHSDLDKAVSLLKMMPEGLLYTIDRGDGGTMCLRFIPNPNFVPKTLESRILRVAQGIMVVDVSQKRLVELRGRLSRDLEFGWGILGKLHKGGTFQLRQEEVDPGQWEITFLDMHLTGRALLFKTIDNQWQESRRRFYRVPESMTLEGAAAMVQSDVQEAMHLNPESR